MCYSLGDEFNFFRRLTFMLLSRVDESLTNLVFACGSDSVRILEFVRWISTVRMVHRLKGCEIGCDNHSANCVFRYLEARLLACKFPDLDQKEETGGPALGIRCIRPLPGHGLSWFW